MILLREHHVEGGRFDAPVPEHCLKPRLRPIACELRGDEGGDLAYNSQLTVTFARAAQIHVRQSCAS